MSTIPIGPFVRFVVAASAAVYANWDTISGQFERAITNRIDPILGFYCQHIFQMTDQASAYSDRERGMFGVHYLNTTGGDPDSSWTTADFVAVETAVENAWLASASLISSGVRLVEHRWYAYGPGVLPPTAPARVTTIVSPKVGTASSSGVHQVASTVTLRTPLRRHWGRIYLPLSSGAVTGNGQLSNTNVDLLANAWKTGLTGASSSQGIVPVVWDRNRKSALGVTAYEVDSVPDIIRRRRPRTTAYKKILTS